MHRICISSAQGGKTGIHQLAIHPFAVQHEDSISQGEVRMCKIKGDNVDDIIKVKGNIILRGMVAAPSNVVFSSLCVSFRDIYYRLPVALSGRSESDVGKGEAKRLHHAGLGQPSICLISNWTALILRCDVFVALILEKRDLCFSIVEWSPAIFDKLREEFISLYKSQWLERFGRQTLNSKLSKIHAATIFPKDKSPLDKTSLGPTVRYPPAQFVILQRDRGLKHFTLTDLSRFQHDLTCSMTCFCKFDSKSRIYVFQFDVKHVYLVIS
eukprot:g6593.t1